MATIDYDFTSITTIQTTTTSATVATIASSEFTAGKKYLIYATANISNTGTSTFSMQITHAGTVLDETSITLLAATGNEWYSYGAFTVWTAVASEDITLNLGAIAGTAQADQICLFKMNLSDDLVENTDWFFDLDSTDTGLSTTPAAGASITFSIAGNWLILSESRVDRTGNTLTTQTRITQSGEASSTTPETIVFTASGTPIELMQNALVVTTTSASNTFTEESTSTGSAHTRLDSAIFALNLNKFRNNTFVYTAGATGTLSTTDFATQVQTLNITPDVAGDVWVGAYWGFDANNSSRETEARLQVDNTDQPATQTSDIYPFDAWAGTLLAQTQINHNVVVSMTAASHTIDLDASTDAVTGAPVAIHRLIWAVSMELPAVGAAATYPGYVGRGGWF